MIDIDLMIPSDIEFGQSVINKSLEIKRISGLGVITSHSDAFDDVAAVD